MTDAVEQTQALPAQTTGSSAATRGGTSVSEEVIEKIAVQAAREVPGVVELGGDVARFFNNVLDRIGLDEVGDASRGVSAEVKGSTVAISIVIVIQASHVVSDVTEAVRVKVIEAVEKFGLQVTQVNIKVDDIEIGKQPAFGAGL